MVRSAESLIKAIGDSPLPPVDKWNPDYCGQLDLIIKADGSWLYGGTPFTRRRMQILFSRVIKKEDAQYYLVTPVEKLGIQVEWMPFTIIDFECISQNAKTLYQFTDNCDNTIALTEPNQIQFSEFNAQRLPIVKVRRNLYASFSRSCYYRLIESAQIIEQGDIHQVQIESNGISYNLGECPIDPE